MTSAASLVLIAVAASLEVAVTWQVARIGLPAEPAR
jgi:hypothetical protein